MTRSVSAVVVLALLGTAHIVSARQTAPQRQPAAGATTLLAGILVAADNGQPIRKADVRLVSASPRSTRTTTTDGEGRWIFEGVPAGEYTLSASRQGYVDMVYGARSPGGSRRGTPIRIAEGQRIENLSLSMPRAAVIAGVVTDEYGEPAYNVPVRALRYAWQNGERVVRSAGTATTDDLGAYRIPHLEPGEYLVTAVPRDTVAAAASRADSLRRMQAERMAAAAGGDREARAAAATMAQAAREGRMPPPIDPVGYVPMFFPGSVLPSGAAKVNVGLGGQLFGIDIRLQIVRTGTISGTVMSVEGEPIQGNLRLIDPAMPVSPIGAWFTSSTPDGRFAFYGVVPGTYVIGGNNSPPGTIGGAPATGGVFQMSALTTVSVTGEDLEGVEVRMQPTSAVTGRVDLSSVTDPLNRDEFRLNLFPVTTAGDWEMALHRVVPDADGSFAFSSIVAARYRVDVAGAPDGWVLDSAMFNARNAADYHLNVEPGGQYEGGVLRLTNQTAEISGTVVNDRSEPVDQHVVVLFPEQRDMWIPQSRRIGVGHTGTDGRFAFRRLPAGDYLLGVVTDLEAGQEFDTEFLAALAEASVPVTLAAGRAEVQTLRVR